MRNTMQREAIVAALSGINVEGAAAAAAAAAADGT